jgi:hypothetical protein
MKTITFKLSEHSIENAIKQVEQYKNSLIHRKNKQFLELLVKEGLEVIESTMSNVEGDSDTTHSVKVRYTADGNARECKITLTGKDVAFIEFGAGVHYNTPVGSSPNPHGEKLGFTIGSYGFGNGKRDSWFYYDENKVPHRSYGTKAAMPMYKAEMEMLKKINKVAREVYG